MTEPRIAQRRPYVTDMKAGKYAWCACGQSKNQPFCDGSHRGSGLGPIIVEIPQPKKIVWCGCKHSHDKPFCDGTHSRLPPESLDA